MVDRAGEVLAAQHNFWGVYERGDILVRVAPWNSSPDDEKKKKHAVGRALGLTVLHQVTATILEDVFTRAAAWEKDTGKAIDCPPKVAQIFLSRRGRWGLHELTGVIAAPLRRPDGSILTEQGYDERTGLLLQSAINWPQIPRCPSQAEVQAAVRTLREPFEEFPFRSKADLAVLMSAILTALQRRLLFSAPAHCFDATTQGSGKSLLADIVAIIATSFPATSISLNTDANEFEKKLVAILIAADPVVSIDNVTRPFFNDALQSILTLPTYTDRILGVSQRTTLLTNLLFLVTGNNLTFSGDMPSRVIICRLEPNVERPEERTFTIANLREHIVEHRGELVAAAITILAGYCAEGRPSQNLKPLGRFEQWSNEIRSAVVWAGFADPCNTREQVIASDPERDATLALYSEWHRVLGDKPVTLRNLAQSAEGTPKAEGDADLKAVLLDVAADAEHRDQISQRRLGAWCRSRIGRVVGDFKLEQGADARSGFKTWRVACVETGSKSTTIADDDEVVERRF